MSQESESIISEFYTKRAEDDMLRRLSAIEFHAKAQDAEMLRLGSRVWALEHPPTTWGPIDHVIFQPPVPAEPSDAELDRMAREWWRADGWRLVPVSAPQSPDYRFSQESLLRLVCAAHRHGARGVK